MERRGYSFIEGQSLTSRLAADAAVAMTRFSVPATELSPGGRRPIVKRRLRDPALAGPDRPPSSPSHARAVS